MKIIVLFLFLSFFASALYAQNEVPQATVGAGLGFVTPYAGTPSSKTLPAYNINAAYYPTALFSIDLEGQFGELDAGVVSKLHNNFTNNYKAGLVTANVEAGLFIDRSRSSFTNFIRHIYAGAGLGITHNDVKVIDKFSNVMHSSTNIPVIPIKLGYDLVLLKSFDNPLLRVDFSYSFNPTIGKGLDGYFGTAPQAIKLYTYYSIRLKYAIDLQ